MIALAVSMLWLACAVWLILRAWRQRNVLPLLEPCADTGTGLPKVCVVVPARDEADNIANCVGSLLVQQSVDLAIVVVDDGSSDGTGEIVAALAAHHPQIRLLAAPVLRPGWSGRTHACDAGLSAVPPDADWLCFMDADVVAHPATVASAVAAASERHLDLLSLMPKQKLVSFAERLMMPCGMYFLAFSEDVAGSQAPDSDKVSATGQFMLFRRRSYEAAGGHAAVRDRICEDSAIALLVKRKGMRVFMLDGSKLLTTRMYTGWATLWPGFAKNLAEMMGGPVRTVTATLVSLVLAWAAMAVPVLDALGCADGVQMACIALAPALIGTAMALGLHIAGARHFAIPWWYGLLFPLGYTIGFALAVDSVRRTLTHRVRWKGRIYS